MKEILQGYDDPKPQVLGIGNFTVSPSNVSVAAGQTVKFSASVPVAWSMAPGSQGSISQDGTYTAPSNIKAKQHVHGCQVLPNNHIFNTKVDTLPVHPSSSAWLSQTYAKNGSVNYLRNYNFNIIDSNTPQQNMIFAYTPANNGPFRILGWPEAKIQGGWFSGPFGLDRHLFSVDKDTCDAEEIYNYYAAGANTANNCPTCTSQSGTKYSLNSYNLPPTGATDAAGMQILPLTLRAQEFIRAVETGGSINHALRFTLINSNLARAFIWPATTNAYAGSGLIPYGARFRLQSSFPETGLSAGAKVLVRQLKEYGIIMSDGGLQWQIPIDDGYLPDPLANALKEIASKVKPENMEAVDISGLMVSSSSGKTNSGSETVIATDTNGNTVSVDIVLKGTALGLKENKYIVQAGSSGFTIPNFLSNASNSGVSWTLTPNVGSINSSGFYVPPATLSTPQIVVAKVASLEDQAIYAQATLSVIPPGTMRFSRDTGFGPDSRGNTWMPLKLLEQAGWFYYATVNTANDAGLYTLPYNYFDDQYYEFYLPNGDYKITGKFTEPSSDANRVKMHLEAQGNIIYRDVDLFASVGVNNPIDFVLPAKVQNGKLQFVIRKVSGYVTKISALQIEPDTGAASVQVFPQNSASLNIGESRQFYAVTSKTSSNQINWSVSPVGSIDSSGLYKAPLNALANDTNVIVTAQSISNPELKSTSSFILKAGIPEIRVNAGGTGFTDASGNKWSGDYGYTGTSVSYSGTSQIAGTTADLQKLYQTRRYNYHWQPKFEYSFTVANGSYSVKLHWAEYQSTDQKLKMDVKINGNTVLTDFDPTAAAGGVQKAYTRTFNTDVTNNQILIEFIPKPSTYIGASINGIEIISGSSGAPTPTPSITPTPTPIPTVDTTAPVISSVTSSNITSTSAKITWTTNEASDSQIEYGLSSAYGAVSPVDTVLTLNHTVNFSNLTPNTTYYYRVKSRDSAGNLSISSGQRFTTASAFVTPAPTPTPPAGGPTPTPTVTPTPTQTTGDWYPPVGGQAFGYKKTITINKAQVQGSLVNFPVLISLTDPELKSTSNSGKVASALGYDLVFTASSNQKLSHEIEKYDPSSGQLIAWVKVPTISSAADVSLNLYFGNSSTQDQQDKQNVWDSNYKGVWHLGDGDSTSDSFYQDSTSNSVDFTMVDEDGDTNQVAGKMGNGMLFNGDADYMYGPANGLKLTGTGFTMSAWVRMANTNDDNPIFWWDDSSGGSYILYAKDGGSNDRPFAAIRTASGQVSASTNYSSGSIFTTDNWVYMVGTYDGSDVSVYYDTNKADSSPQTGNMSYAGYGTQRLNLFKSSGAKYRAGGLDELRISNTARSSDWIKTEYNNQSNPASFISVSSASAYVAPAAPTPTPVVTPTPEATPTPSVTSTTPTVPVVTFQNTPAPNTPLPSQTNTSTSTSVSLNPIKPFSRQTLGTLKLINQDGTFYLVQNGYKHGITNPGMLFSYGFTFSQGKPATQNDKALPEGEILMPNDGSLVKSKEDPTVYLVSRGLRHGFSSQEVFLSLGYKFSSVLLVTDPELQKLPKGIVFTDPTKAHFDGTDVNIDGTVYLIKNQTLYGYPSLKVYNSWHIPGDITKIVKANSADRQLPKGSIVELRVVE